MQSGAISAPLAKQQLHTPPPPPWADPRRWRINNFDAMRLLFAVMVIVTHSYFLAERRQDPLGVATRGATNFGVIAVDAFFIISGFLISSSWAQGRSLLSYLRKRVARIYPGFAGVWIVMAVAVPILVAGHFILVPGKLLKLPVHVLLLEQYVYPNAFASNPYPFEANGSLWTIGYEFRCYLLLPILGFLGLSRRPWLTLALLITALASMWVIPADYGGSRWIIFVLGQLWRWPRLLSCFAGGMALYAFRNAIPRSGWLALAAAALLVAACRSSLGWAVAFPIAGTYLIMWAAYLPLGLSNFARNGDFSYGVYLYSFFIQQLVVLTFHGKVSPLRLFLISFPISLLIGILSWHGIERHFLRTARSLRPALKD
jgi:peptidoglycan/LPS O-acetylase OafA/YrhL